MSLLFCIAAVTAFLLTGNLRAEDFPIKTDTRLHGGMSLTDGNSETIRLNFGFLAEGEKNTFGSYRSGAAVNYGKSVVDGHSETDVENSTVFAIARRMIDSSLFGYVDTKLERDIIAKLSYRISAGPGLGSYLWKNKQSIFSVELGPSYIWEKTEGERGEYFSLHTAQRLDIHLSDIAKLWESMEYLPDISEFSNYRFNSEIGLETLISSRISLRLSVENKYTSQPGLEVDPDDLSVTCGFSIQL